MRKLTSLAGIGASLFLCFASTTLPAASVLAATTPPNTSGQALEIAPPVMTLNANPGQTVKAQIKLRDVSKSKLVVSNQINDFVASGEDGTPKILLDSEDTNNPFSLKDWITPLASFTLSPQQIQTVAVTIKVPANASPGGHYGVIRFTGTPPDLSGSGVSLSASLGALVLLTVNGKLTDNLAVQEFSVNDGGKAGTLFESTPLTFTVRLHNTGNVQETPTGHILVTDMFGKAVAGVNINLPPRNVLPASTRKFDGALDKNNIGNKRLFGRYTAALTVTYGTGSKKTLTSSITFWVIPYKLLAIALVLIIGGFFALRFLIKRYNEHIIGKAQKRPRRR